METILREELAVSERLVRDGHEVVPRFRVLAPDGDWTVFVPLPDDLSARYSCLRYITEFLAWRCARGFVMSAETWLGPAGALQDDRLLQGEMIISTGITRDVKLGALRRIERAGGLRFTPVEWFDEDAIDPVLHDLLPPREMTISVEMAAELKRLFGTGGAFEARRVN